MKQNYQLSFNDLQTALSMLYPKYHYMVAGRGFGKSTYFGYMIAQIVRNLPGASGIIVAKTYTHVLTSILPSAFQHLERMGFIRDVHYVIGKRPPREWGLPYQPPVKNFENYITFAPQQPKSKPVGFYLVSQDRIGGGRGPNTDFLLTDETLRLDKERLDNEISPTIRANKDIFTNVHWHLGEFHSTSMPYTKEGRWILEYMDYYLHEYGVDYLSTWRQIVNLQLDILDTTDPQNFKLLWNQMIRLREKIRPRLSQDGTLFTFANAFDNWKNVGLSYIREQRRRLPELIFMLEIMNVPMVLNSQSFYALDEDTHVYYDSWDDNYTETQAISSGFNFDEIQNLNAAYLNRNHYNPNNPLYLFFDWGGTISVLLVCQFDHNKKELTVVKEFYVLPPGEMPKRLINEFAEFFQTHQNRDVLFIHDTYGDDKSNSIQGNNSINEDAIQTLQHHNFRIYSQYHRYKEPPYSAKWNLMQKIMHGGEDAPFTLKIDGNNCKYLIIALRDARVRQKGDKLEKDKSLERKKDADQRTAPHPTDALDKGCYWLQNNVNSGTFLDVSII